MRVEIFEHAGCFSLEFVPENTEDISMMARIKMNHVKQVRSVNVSFFKESFCTGSVVIGKQKRERAYIN